MTEQPAGDAGRREGLQAESERLRIELARLSGAVAGGASLASVLEAIRQREARRDAIAAQLATLQGSGGLVLDQLEDVASEVRRRLGDWRAVLSVETTQARQMLGTLLEGRLVFTPRPKTDSVEFTGRGDYGRLFTGLVGISQALASPAGGDRGGVAPGPAGIELGGEMRRGIDQAA